MNFKFVFSKVTECTPVHMCTWVKPNTVHSHHLPLRCLEEHRCCVSFGCLRVQILHSCLEHLHQVFPMLRAMHFSRSDVSSTHFFGWYSICVHTFWWLTRVHQSWSWCTVVMYVLQALFLVVFVRTALVVKIQSWSPIVVHRILTKQILDSGLGQSCLFRHLWVCFFQPGAQMCLLSHTIVVMPHLRIEMCSSVYVASDQNGGSGCAISVSEW